ncbi:MAG: hypothetical protein ACYDGR_16105 [Candidatus Dormibacteria bacterium]
MTEINPSDGGGGGEGVAEPPADVAAVGLGAPGAGEAAVKEGPDLGLGTGGVLPVEEVGFGVLPGFEDVAGGGGE